MASSSSFFSGTNPTPTEYENGVDLVAQATAQATAALASATDAAASSQEAQGYSVSAGTSADTATTQASAASASALSASNSATTAGSSATTATNQATAAASSASTASTAATNASNSATAAAGSASSASTYATNAANSATAAANSATDAANTLANALTKTDNLNSLSNKATARTNLGVAIGSNVQAWDADLDAIAAISSTSGLLKKTAANTWSLDTTSYLSGTVGLANGGTGATDAAGARTALGLGTAATAAATSFLQVANNLSEVTPATARTNLGLGSAATLASSAVLQSANNLSDLGNVTTARTNLGLTSLATTTPGTGVATALGVNTGTAGAFVVNGGALGTPASGNLSNCTFPTLNQNTTGTASNVTGTVAVGNGGTGLTSLTAGYIPYGNGAGAFGNSANLFFNGTNLGIGTSSPTSYGAGYTTLAVNGSSAGSVVDTSVAGVRIGTFFALSDNSVTVGNVTNNPLAFRTNNIERMRITSGGLVGIGTTAPATALTVYNTSADSQIELGYASTYSWKFGRKASDGSLQFTGLNGGATLTDALTLTLSGNLGLGITPSAWGSAWKAQQVQGYSVSTIGNAEGNVSLNVYNDNNAWRYIGSDYATQYRQGSGAHKWFTAPSGTAGNAISFTQAMTLTAQGYLGLGVTSPSLPLHIYSDSVAGVGSTQILCEGYRQGYGAGVSFQSRTSAGGTLLEMARVVADGETSWDTTPSNQNAYLRFFTTSNGSSGERFRISSSGNTSIGSTSAGGMRFYVNGGSLFSASPGGYGVGISGALTTGRIGTYGASTASVVNTYWDDSSLELSAGTSSGYVSGISITARGASAYADTIRFATRSAEVARIDSSGTLLVGTTSAIISGTRVNVAGNNGVASGLMSFGNTASATKKWQIGPDANGNFIVFNDAGAGLYIAYSGTTWTSSSDERLKDIIEPITDGIGKVSQLRSVIGKFKNDIDGTRRPFLIAQDVQKAFPEAVDASNPDSLGVQYTDIIPLLVSAIKELSAKVTALEAANG